MHTPTISVPLGQIVATRTALKAVPTIDMLTALERHERGDWGDLDTEDLSFNDQAVKEGGRLLSAYHTATDLKFWIITEWDRSVTTVLLPEDY